ncbi:MAG TPA: rRNA maturation RNase YbeY [Candidatus Paceibacterota bacterium]|nr:rRNA maturation RNase YbeY [Candidatus Paceibacterota bacterium]
MRRGEFSIQNLTRAAVPGFPFERIKDDILGPGYDLSLALVGEAMSRALNKRYRGKDRPTNVLSFPYSDRGGELVLCPAVIRRESKNPDKNFGKTYAPLFLFLIIHGMLHLKGMDHGKKMEGMEEFYCTKYLSRTKSSRK